MSQAKLGGTNTFIYHVKPYTKMSYFDQMICNTKKIHFVCNCQLTLPVHLSSPSGLSEFRVLNQLFIIFLLTSALSVLFRITVPPWYLQCFLKTIEKKEFMTIQKQCYLIKDRRCYTILMKTYTLEKAEGTIKNEQSRETGNIGHTRHRKCLTPLYASKHK